MRKLKSFRHPVDARSNEKIAALIGAYGPAGYGVYWMIVEMLHGEEGMRIAYSEQRIRRLQAQVGMSGQDAFARLLNDLVDTYELLAIEEACLPDRQGYLVSAIGYHPRHKRKEPAPAQRTNEAPASAQQEPDTEDQPPLREYVLEDLRYHDELKTYIAANAPAVAAMQQPLSLHQTLYLRDTYGQNMLFDALEQLQQHPTPADAHTSAYHLLRQVLEQARCASV